MPIYFFHLRSGEKILPDEIGIDLADNATAIQVTRQTVGEMFAEATTDRGECWFGWTVQVVTADNRPVAAMTIPDEPAT